MSTAKKFEMAPDEVYIQQALKEGRAKLVNDLSMKALGKPDTAFQARDIGTPKGLNMDHVKRLDLIYQLDKKLAPVIVFMATRGKVVKMILADGFHRHEVCRLAKSECIRAYVVEVPMDQIEHEARLFAAMCNQVTLLDRTDADKRKAVEMLLADPECHEWSSKMIARHCGVSDTSVRRWRDEYLIRNQIQAPSHVIRSDGNRMLKRKPMTAGKPRIHKKKNGPGFLGYAYGKHVYGKTESELINKINTITLSETDKRLSLSSNSLCDYLNRYLLTERCPLYFGSSCVFSGIKTANAVITSATETGADAILKAIGILRLLPHHTGQVDPRRIVACYAEDYPAALLDLARKDGVEFLTPDELVASLKDRDPT